MELYSLEIVIITKLTKNFEDYAHKESGVEFWFARDLQKLLGYSKWENFEKVIEKAKESCNNSGFRILDHFPDIRKKVNLGSGAIREIDDIMLTRYACYLIAQNGDSRKEEIAFAQSYFAIQTRKQELIEERIRLTERINARKKLKESESIFSKLLYERGVDDKGFARIRSKGDKVLFGGKTTQDMKTKLGVSSKRPLGDFLNTVVITAKELANQISTINVNRDDKKGELEITKIHKSSNSAVREALLKENVIPEELPPEEDIKKLERRVVSNERKLEKSSRKRLNKKST